MPAADYHHGKGADGKGAGEVVKGDVVGGITPQLGGFEHLGAIGGIECKCDGFHIGVIRNHLCGLGREIFLRDVETCYAHVYGNHTRGAIPVFAAGSKQDAAGNSAQKMNHITHNKYLTYCYDCLCEITGSLVVLGFSFGDNDTHIIDAINKAAKHGPQRGDKLLSIYVGVFSEGDYNHMKSIEGKFQTKVNYFDARTAHIWE